MGATPLHTSKVGLRRNLNNNCTSPQFHVVYKNLFQRFHSAEGEPPAEWPNLIVFDRFCYEFDDSEFFPELADEWLNPVNLARRQETELNHWNKEAYQDGAAPQRAPENAATQRETT